jgi:hypothetical protein
MIVDRVALRHARDGASVSARVRTPSRAPADLVIAVDGVHADALRPSGSPWLVATLLPAMMTGRTLVVDAPVSPALKEGMEQAQDVLIRWWGQRYDLKRVTVDAPVQAPSGGGGAVAAYFSRGVDSSFTVLEDGDGLTHLLYSASVDFAGDEGRRRRALHATQRVAGELGLPVIPVTTNLRPFHDGYAGWVHGYGQALAAIGHALGGLLGEVRISAAYRTDQGVPWASHPVLEGPLSSESTAIRHVGSDVRRIDKVAALAGHGSLLRQLRVCIVDETDGNCGRCEKCLRTMLELEVTGGAGQAEFDRPLSPHAVEQVRASAGQAIWWREVLEHPGMARLDPAYRRAIASVLADAW